MTMMKMTTMMTMMMMTMTTMMMTTTMTTMMTMKDQETEAMRRMILDFKRFKVSQYSKT